MANLAPDAMVQAIPAAERNRTSTHISFESAALITPALCSCVPTGSRCIKSEDCAQARPLSSALHAGPSGGATTLRLPQLRHEAQHQQHHSAHYAQWRPTCRLARTNVLRRRTTPDFTQPHRNAMSIPLSPTSAISREVSRPLRR